MNNYVATVMDKHARHILDGDGVCIPDDAEEMNWRLFFAHSQDMQGFRADIFTGGKNEADHPTDSSFKSLRDRWSDSRSMMDGLAVLWDNPNTCNVLKRYSNPFRPLEEKRAGIRPCLELLRGHHGNEATRVFADTLDSLQGDKIARKTNSMIRAYSQNAALLRSHDFSFRTYLVSIHNLSLPTTDPERIEFAESAWLGSLNQDFYNVGPALANYLICDWLLGFWRERRIGWFRSYKEDSAFNRALADANKLPPDAGLDFVGYCQSVKIHAEWIPARYTNLTGVPVPPRLLNEAIWMEENKSS